MKKIGLPVRFFAVVAVVVALLAGNLWREMRQDDRDTALFVAIEARDVGGARTALDAGASANATRNGGTASDAEQTVWERLRRLVTRPKPSPSGGAALPGPLNPQTALGAALSQSRGDAPYERERSAAARRVIALLIARGANPNAASYDTLPLATAIWSGDHAVVKNLLDAGALPGGPAWFVASGGTPLITAADTGDAGAVSLLLAHGANPNGRDAGGQTALHHTVGAFYWEKRTNRAETVRHLLAHGADPTLRDKKAQTALVLARATATTGGPLSGVYRNPDSEREQRAALAALKRAAATGEGEAQTGETPRAAKP